MFTPTTEEEVALMSPLYLPAKTLTPITRPDVADPNCRTTYQIGGNPPAGWVEVDFDDWLNAQLNCPDEDPIPGDLPDPCGCQDDIDALRADLCEHASASPGHGHGPGDQIPECD